MHLAKLVKSSDYHHTLACDAIQPKDCIIALCLCSKLRGCCANPQYDVPIAIELSFLWAPDLFKVAPSYYKDRALHYLMRKCHNPHVLINDI